MSLVVNIFTIITRRDGLQYLKQSGWLSYRDQLIKLVKKGQVDPLDAESLAGELA